MAGKKVGEGGAKASWDKALFMRALCSDHAALLKSCAMLIESREPSTLSEIGLSGQALGAIASSIGASDLGDEEVMQAVSSLSIALACSDLPASEQRPFAAEVERLWGLDSELPLVDFDDGNCSASVVESPGASIWLAMGATVFNVDEAWLALRSASEEAKLAALAPKGFVDQAAQDEGEPPSHVDIQDYDIRLVRAYAEAVWVRHGAERVSRYLEILDLKGSQAKAELLSLGVQIASSEGFVDDDAVFSGWLLTQSLGEDAGDALDLLARRCESMEISPGKRSASQGGLAHLFLFNPSGSGGVELFFLPGGGDMKLTLADYAVACGSDPKWSTDAPELAALASKLAQLGRLEQIESRGGPAFLAGLIDLQCKIRAGRLDSDSACAAGEALELRFAVGSASVKPSGSALRV